MSKIKNNKQFFPRKLLIELYISHKKTIIFITKFKTWFNNHLNT